MSAVDVMLYRLQGMTSCPCSFVSLLPFDLESPRSLWSGRVKHACKELELIKMLAVEGDDKLHRLQPGIYRDQGPCLVTQCEPRLCRPCRTETHTIM